jgi:hypothetical protein
MMAESDYHTQANNYHTNASLTAQDARKAKIWARATFFLLLAFILGILAVGGYVVYSFNQAAKELEQEYQQEDPYYDDEYYGGETEQVVPDNPNGNGMSSE